MNIYIESQDRYVMILPDLTKANELSLISLPCLSMLSLWTSKRQQGVLIHIIIKSYCQINLLYTLVYGISALNVFLLEKPTLRTSRLSNILQRRMRFLCKVPSELLKKSLDLLYNM